MPRALVASFGFDEKYVVRAIIRHGVGAGDKVVLVTSKKTEKTEKAYGYVKELADTVAAEVELAELGDKVYNFPELVRELKGILTKLTEAYETVTVLLSGGMRVLVLGLYTAILLLPPPARDKVKVEVDTEDVGKLVEVPQSLVKVFTPPELGAKIEILKVIVEKPGMTIEDIAKELNKDESTVRRQLQALLDLSLVRLEGRPARVYPTEAAIALV